MATPQGLTTIPKKEISNQNGFDRILKPVEDIRSLLKTWGPKKDKEFDKLEEAKKIYSEYMMNMADASNKEKIKRWKDAQDASSAIEESILQQQRSREFLDKQDRINAKKKEILDNKARDNSQDKSTEEKKPEQKSKIIEKDTSKIMKESTLDGVLEGMEAFYDKGGLKDLSRAILGPLALITEPLSEIVNFKDIFGKISEKFSPTDSKVKEKDPGIFWLWQKMKKDKEPEDSGFDIGKIGLGGIGSMLGPLLKTMGGAALIAGGLAMGIMDGLKGMDMAKEWGVSNIGGFIGGFLGGTESGFKGAFANMGKWAMIGAGIGMIAGPPGAIIGGLIGAAIGGILGFIGGENIAKGVDAIGAWFQGLWDGIVNSFKSAWEATVSFFSGIWDGLVNIGSTIGNFFTSLWDSPVITSIKTIVSGIGEAFSNLYKVILSPILGIFKSIIDTGSNIINIFMGEGDIGSKIEGIVGEIIFFIPSMISNATNIIKDGFSGMVNGLSNIFSGMGDLLKIGNEIFANINMAIANFFIDTLPKFVTNTVIPTLMSGFNFVKDMAIAINSAMGHFFGAMIPDFFTNTVIPGLLAGLNFINDMRKNLAEGFRIFTTSIIAGIVSGFDRVSDLMKDIPILGNIFNFFNDKILKPIAGFFTGVANGIADFVSNPIDFIINTITFINTFMGDLFTSLGTFIHKSATKIFGSVSGFIQKFVFKPIFGFFESVNRNITNFARNPLGTLTSIFEGVTTFISTTIIDPVKNFFTRIWKTFDDNVIKPIGRWFTDVGDNMKKFIIEPISNFFKSIGDFFNSIFDTFEFMSKDWIKGIVAITNPESREATELATFKSDKQKERLGTPITATPVRTVRDAIITPQGRVIEPSINDTIIATRSPMSILEKEARSNISTIETRNAPQPSQDVSKLFRELIDTVKNKPFNNQIINTETPNFNFDNFRMAH